jgi:hypothetical protein
MSFITDILNFFKGLFNASEKLYNSLSAEEQLLGQQASGIVAAINADLTAAPTTFWTTLSTAFPSLTQTQVTAYMNSALVTLGVINADGALSFEDALTALQAYLSKHQGNTWVAITQGLVAIFLDVLSPGTNAFEKITSIMQYIYIDIIKPIFSKAA